MSEDIPPRNDIGSQDLGSVPMKPDPVPTKPTVPVGGGRPQVGPTTGSAIQPSTVGTPAVAPVGSSKPVIIGLSIAAAGLAALSGYEYLQTQDLQEQLGEAGNQVASASQVNQALESDLKKVRDELDLANKDHESAISEKDTELKAALANAEKASDEMAKQAEENKELLVKIEAADAAVQEKALIEAELAELKSTNQELTDEKAKVEEEVQRLESELAKRKPTPSDSVAIKTTQPKADRPLISYDEETEPTQRRQPVNTLAWVRLGKYETGEKKGRWYYVAPNGFVSPLYGSRELAIQNAELRAGFAPGTGGASRSTK